MFQKPLKTEKRLARVVEDPVELLGSDITSVEVENNSRLKTKRELSNTLCSHRSSACCERLSYRSTLLVASFDNADGFFTRSTMNNPSYALFLMTRQYEQR